MTPTATQDSDFEIHLDLYEGPMALLLYLIERDSLDVFDIPIAQITQEYLRYLEWMGSSGIRVGGEFLVMATMLMQIKARMLLPRVSSELAQTDPRSELVSRLLVAQRFRTAARALNQRLELMKDYAFRPPPIFEHGQYSIVQNVQDLIGAFQKALEEFCLAHGGSYAINLDSYPIEVKIDKILALLAKSDTVAIEDVWRDETVRAGLVACFLAILELMKRGSIHAVQKKPYGEIYLVKALLN